MMNVSKFPKVSADSVQISRGISWNHLRVDLNLSPLPVIAAVLAATIFTGLNGCSASSEGPPAGMAGDCLAGPGGPGEGWYDLDAPVSDLFSTFQTQATRPSWERPADGGYVYRVARTDSLTGKAKEVSFYFIQAGPRTSKSCGPVRFAIDRAVIDGKEIAGADVTEFVTTSIVPAMMARIVRSSPQTRSAPVPPVGTPVAPITPPPLGQSGAPPPSPSTSSAVRAPSADADEAPALGNCHMDSCSWSKVLSRVVRPAADGNLHTLTLLGGSTAFNDRSAGHIVWNAQPHTVAITCSLTHPSVRDGDQTDDLPLNAAGSPVPDVLMSSYTLYAAECHPEAKDLDPDALARRYGYNAKIDE